MTSSIQTDSNRPMKTLTTLFVLFIAVSGFIHMAQIKRRSDALAKRDAEWRKAAQPIFDARDISGKNAGPKELSKALDANTGYHQHESWKWTAPKAATVIQIRRADRM